MTRRTDPPARPGRSAPSGRSARPGRPARSGRPAPPAGADRSAEISDARLGSGTGRSAADWFALLDRADAARLSHERIARLLIDDHEVAPWWAQVITVRYEQGRGLPSPGLQPDGSYAVAVGRSLRGEPLELLELLVDRLAGYVEGVQATVVRSATRPSAEWTLSNGDVLTVAVSPSTGGKCSVAVTQARLRLPERVQPVREGLAQALGVMVDRQN